jgi:hypothetical protein
VADSDVIDLYTLPLWSSKYLNVMMCKCILNARIQLNCNRDLCDKLRFMSDGVMVVDDVKMMGTC